MTWSDYTGRPRYCVQELWLLRAWAQAVGDVAAMEPGLQARLYELESQHEWQYHCVEVAAGHWEYILRLKPAALPAQDVWFDICVQEPCSVADMVQVVEEERHATGVHWSGGGSA